MYKQVILRVDRALANTLEDILFEHGALSTTISDNNEGNELEELIFDEPDGLFTKNSVPLWNDSKLTVLFAQDIDVDSIFVHLYELLAKKIEYQIEILPDQDWVSLSQKQHELIFISQNFVIASQWHNIPQNCQSIKLNAGLAFGSGTHPTTKMCMQWLVDNDLSLKTVLDFGCGSGILAITAAILGAKEVVGIDIDPQAIESSNNNKQLNNITNAYFCSNEQLASLKIKNFDVVLANILAAPLIKLSNMIAQYCNEYLILSGLLQSQVTEVLVAYQHCFDVLSSKTVDGWAAIYLVKKR
jgi:ribosomal protein L11 methyltransferase